jgi:hypothetical protein
MGQYEERQFLAGCQTRAEDVMFTHLLAYQRRSGQRSIAIHPHSKLQNGGFCRLKSRFGVPGRRRSLVVEGVIQVLHSSPECHISCSWPQYRNCVHAFGTAFESRYGRAAGCFIRTPDNRIRKISGCAKQKTPPSEGYHGTACWKFEPKATTFGTCHDDDNTQWYSNAMLGSRKTAPSPPR